MAQISRHFFTSLFFFCNWILHIWNRFYTSKISLLSPLIIGSKLTFISSSSRWLPCSKSSQLLYIHNINLNNISFTLNTMIALELNWLTLVMSSDPIDIIDVTHCCAIFLFCWANNYYWCDTWWSENEMIILWKKKQASFAFPVSLHWWSTKHVSPTPIINWLKL